MSSVDLGNVLSFIIKSVKFPVLPLKSPVYSTLPEDENLAISSFSFKNVSSGSKWVFLV